jgi:transcriptional regulator
MKDNNKSSGSRNAKAVTWRRAKVLELTSQGNSQVEISTILRVGEATISRDMSYLRQQANEDLDPYTRYTPRGISKLYGRY